MKSKISVRYYSQMPKVRMNAYFLRDLVRFAWQEASLRRMVNRSLSRLVSRRVDAVNFVCCRSISQPERKDRLQFRAFSILAVSSGCPMADHYSLRQRRLATAD